MSRLIQWSLAQCPACPWRHLVAGGEGPVACTECGTPWEYRSIMLPETSYRSIDDLLATVLGALGAPYDPSVLSWEVNNPAPLRVETFPLPDGFTLSDE